MCQVSPRAFLMFRVTRLLGKPFVAFWRRGSSFFWSVVAAARAVRTEPIARRRLVIILAAFLVMAYALGVLGYILFTPEVGIRIGFTPSVSKFYSDFLYPEHQQPLSEGDHLLYLGSRRVDTWAQFLRGVADLDRQAPEPIDPETSVGELLGGDGRAAGKTHVVFKGYEIVRVLYRHGDQGPEQIAWCRLTHSPVEDILPSLLWFLLKIGLFTVGAIVFW